jgi:CheY-like chemotaxis protein
MKILLADDMKSFLDLGRSFLSRAECELHTAANGIEAVRLALRLRPDLILLDIEMPQMTGIEACRIIKSNPQLSSTPVIIITATDRMEDARKAGADDFARKPIDEVKFLSLIKQHVKIKERYEPRVPFTGEIKLRNGLGELAAVAQDISPTGMAMRLADPPLIGELLTARFAVPLSEGAQQIQTSCIVVRHLDRGMAVRFYEMTSGAALALQDFLLQA